MVISYGKQSIDKYDKLTVLKSFNQLNLTNGKYLNLFEKKLKIYLGCKYVLTCSSGTSSIFLALKSLGIKKNDIVIMPIVNFIASVNISKLLGCKLFFADIDTVTGQMTPETLQKCIHQNKLKKIKAVITMYMAGHPYNVINFYKLKKIYKFKLIEDACHALGSEYKEKNYFKIGSCKHSDISTFSFHPLKTITTGEGGCLVTNNKLLYETAKNLRNHGFETNKKKLHWNYELTKSSLNFRLSEINCALGFSQIQKIEKFLKKRRIIAKNYHKLFNNDPFLKKFVNIPNITNGHVKSAWHLFLININFSYFNCDKMSLMKHLLKKNIRVQFHYTPFYEFKKLSIKSKFFFGAKKYKQTTLSIPIFYDLSKKQQEKVVFIIKKFLEKKVIRK